MESPIIIESVKQPKRRRRQPASAHQIAVNRANAARSTGPNTPEGKASSSQNAIKHGLAASRFTVVRVEDPAQLQELRANLLHCYRPVNTQEIEALDCMARAQFSMRRAAQLEASLFTTSINDAWADPRVRMEPELEQNISVSVDQNRGFYLAEGIRMLAKESNGLSLLLRYQAHAERQYRRALEEFERLKKLRAEMPNEPISDTPFPDELKRNEVVIPGGADAPGGAGGLCHRPSDATGGADASGGAGGLSHRPSDATGGADAPGGLVVSATAHPTLVAPPTPSPDAGSPAPDSRVRYIKGLQRETETLFRSDERRRSCVGRFRLRGTGLGPAAIAGADLVRAEMRGLSLRGWRRATACRASQPGYRKHLRKFAERQDERLRGGDEQPRAAAGRRVRGAADMAGPRGRRYFEDEKCLRCESAIGRAGERCVVGVGRSD